MRRSRRCLVLSMALALTGLVLSAPAASGKTGPTILATDTKSGTTRAGDIVPGQPYILELEDHPGRQVGIAVSFRWDYLLVTDDTYREPAPVVFHTSGEGYIIESTRCHWGGYCYWTAGTGSIWLDQRSKATVFYLVTFIGEAFVLTTGPGDDGEHVLYSATAPGWLRLSTHNGHGHPPPYVRAFWRIVEVS